jgi:ATP-dependent helicase/nuclease subunit B
LAPAIGETEELAQHWERALARLQTVLVQWPAMLAARGAVDLAERRNLLLQALARRWARQPPDGFTVAAGITTAAPAVAKVLGTVARMPDGLLVLPGLALPGLMPDEEWEALGPDERGRGEQTHPQYHLKLLLDRIGIARGEVEPWRYSGRSASPAARSRASPTR